MTAHPTGLKVRQLQILREVLRAGSARRAAKALSISQPAVSQHVSQLEAAIGFPLFLRENHRLKPTDKALELLKTVEAAFAGFDRVEKSIAFLKTDEPKHVAIAAPNAFCFRTIPKVVQDVRKGSRSFSFRIDTGSYADITSHVLTGRSDIGISRLPLDPRMFDWTPVAIASNVCLFPHAHVFTSKNVITPEDLVDQPIIDIDPQFSAHQMNINALRYMGSEPEIAVEYDATGHDAGFVLAGVGVSITNSLIAREYNVFGLETRPFEPGATYHYVIFWKKERNLSRVMEETIKALLRAWT